ncbi:uncharacterized protein BO66DRAFT_471976 [Aspergillus aculeatinus CBS 121060]|uniref:Uncharacterized protein n=1 Tax=Aspergillus aculeatinus CBS 121060 TaxID=1448322 RepID=A0ACD1H7T6_9EURO|nr:hypothetical protein BO66DRAFT_471976 [Aspergillus aculeatinus CBS 121060]RAH69472.1 hypothetical protein BO66DRAFT_471976 [Aspergillus aculeatinus CBS 121060]
MDVSSGVINAFASSLSPEQIAEAEKSIDGAGRITLYQFKIAIGVLLGLAFLSFSGRIFIRLFTRRRLYLDDGFLILAFICLCVVTAMLYLRVQIVYILFGVLSGDSAAYALAIKHYDKLLEQSKWQLGYITLLWTVVFSVKWCYFAFFYPLLRNVSRKLIWYYRFAIVFSVASWIAIVVGEELIACPYLGEEAGKKCFPDLPASRTSLLAAFWAFPCLDALSDLIIVTIPILLLRNVQLRTLTKLGIGCFVCLSGFMFACSIIRAAGTYYRNALDYPWQVFWLHAEACIGVTMASITAYRSTLIGSNEVSDRVRGYLSRIKRTWKQRTDGSEVESRPRTAPVHDKNRWGFPRIPRGTITGLRSVLGRSTAHRDTTVLTAGSMGGEEEADYHAYLKGGKGSIASSHTRVGSRDS